MDLWEVMLEVGEGNPWIEISSLYPGRKFIMWYLWARQLIKFSYDEPTELQSIIESMEERNFRIIKTEKSERMALVLAEPNFNGDADIWDISTHNNCLELPPTIFENGKGVFRIAGFDEKSVASFVDQVRKRTEANVLHKRRLPLNVVRSSLWTSSILSSFSPRQAESLIKAQVMGYYETPRKTTTGKVAKSVGLGRSSFEDHLRKAENILINSFVPYLNLFNTYGEEDFHHLTLSSQVKKSKF